MRTLVDAAPIALILGVTLAAGCAQEHDFSNRLHPHSTQSTNPVTTDDDAGDEQDTEVDDADVGFEPPSGPHHVRDAGLSPAGHHDLDASDEGAPRPPRDAATADADGAPEPQDAAPDVVVVSDAGPPGFEPITGEQLEVSSFAGPCESATPPAPAPEPSCRPDPWHTPACFATPLACAALHESSTCLSVDDKGGLVFTGLDSGATCRSLASPAFDLAQQFTSFAWLGPDFLTIEQGVVVKHAISDGSFDAARGAADAVFTQGERVLVRRPGGHLLRYASWDDLKQQRGEEEIVNLKIPGVGGVFGASAKHLVALWPDGHAELLLDDAIPRSVALAHYDPGRDGDALAVDVTDEGRLLLLTRDGIWVYDIETGELQARHATQALWGLDCEPGYAKDAKLPNSAAAKRPGFAPDETNTILHADPCTGPFNGPHYMGEQGGPELLVIGTFFHDQNEVSDERTTPHVLVLTSVQSTEWSIQVADDARVERILINGGPADVTVQSATPVPIEYHTDSLSLGTHPGNWPSREVADFQANLEANVGRPVTEIVGCHFGSRYVVRDVAPLCVTP